MKTNNVMTGKYSHGQMCLVRNVWTNDDGPSFHTEMFNQKNELSKQLNVKMNRTSLSISNKSVAEVSTV